MYCVFLQREIPKDRYCPICDKLMHKDSVRCHVKSKQHLSNMDVNNIIENVTTQKRSFKLYTINNGNCETG